MTQELAVANEERVQGEGNISLFVRSWRPDGDVRAVVAMVKCYEGHYHDLLNDLDKELVMRDILGWIDARIPAGTGR